MSNINLDDETWRPISPKYLTLQLMWLGLAAVISCVMTVVVALVVSKTVIGTLVGATFLMLFSLRGLLLWRQIAQWGYLERADDLLVRHGIMFKRLAVIPYGRMQYVEVSSGPVERLFGIASVVMHTAAAASDVTINGLDAVEAARLRDQLAALGEAKAMGL